MFLFSAASLIVIGIATLWALRVAYGGRMWDANNVMALCLSIIGWVLVMLGIACIVSPFGMLIALAVFGMTVARYRHGERRALLWTLSLAAEKGIPLSASVRAFAARRSDEMARRALTLANMLDAGRSLSHAMAASGNPLPPDTELMVRLSGDASAAAATLRESGEFGDETEQAWTPIFGQLVYLVLIALCTVLCFAFIMIKIMPTFHAIFDDFGAELPPTTQLTIVVSNGIAANGWLFTPLLLYAVGAFLVSAYFYARGRIWLPPPVSWLCPRTEKPTLFRGLAVCIEQEMPINQALTRIADNYPSTKMRRRLTRSAAAAAAGGDWTDVMQQAGLITAAEAAVLKSSQAAGNLGWALRELGQVATRRMIYRAKTVVTIASAITLVLLAVPVFLLAVGCFMPLVKLIQESAHVAI